MPAASSRRRTVATRSCWRSRSAGLAFRWRMLASAPAARAGGSEVVKMKPEAKLRTKSHNRRRGGDIAADHAEGLGQRALDHGQPVRIRPSRSAMPPPRGP